MEENIRRAKAAELGQQGAWTKWHVPEGKITWNVIWCMEPLWMKFLIRSVYDTLPSPANLATWGLCEDRVCKLSGQNGSLAHILSGCKTTLTQGPYRHDKVPELIADVLENSNYMK